MNIDHSKKIIYVHIPKTGGTTVEKVLFNRTRRSEHKSLSFYQSRVAGQLDNFKILSVIRNPYLRFFSIINYFLHGGNGSKCDTDIGKTVRQNLDRDNFEWYVKLSKKYDFFKPQSYFINPKYLKLPNLNLLQFEKFSDDFLTFCQKNQIVFNNIKLRTTPHPTFTITPQQIEFVNKFYQADFELFSYPQIRPNTNISYNELKYLVGNFPENIGCNLGLQNTP